MNKGSLLEPSFTQPLSTALRFLVINVGAITLSQFTI